MTTIQILTLWIKLSTIQFSPDLYPEKRSWTLNTRQEASNTRTPRWPRAKNGRAKPGDTLRNEVGREWEISVGIQWKWAKRLRHPEETSVKLADTWMLGNTSGKSYQMFSKGPSQLLYSAFLHSLELMLSCVGMRCTRFKRTHRVNLPSWMSGKVHTDNRSQPKHTPSSENHSNMWCVEGWHISGVTLSHKSRRGAVLSSL